MDEYNFTKKFRKLLYQNEITQQELADRIGVKKQTISHWATGKRFPKADMLKKIADFFGVPMSYFLESNEDKKPSADDVISYAKRILALTEEQRAILDQILTQFERSGRNG